MQIYEAAYEALREIGRPTHLRELVAYISEKQYFAFGAKSPERALGVAIDRRSKGAVMSRTISPTLFYRHAPATYGLLDWLSDDSRNDLALDEEIEAAVSDDSCLDTTLLLEAQLHEWLYRNLLQNRLTALGFGELSLVDPSKQSSAHGKYWAPGAGEIDMLLRTASGDFVVIELKRASSDATVGQICRYVGWVMEHLAMQFGKQVHGLILAREVSESLRYAVKATHSSIRFRTLEFDAVLGASCR
jgi:hypothetical protein